MLIINRMEPQWCSKTLSDGNSHIWLTDRHKPGILSATLTGLTKAVMGNLSDLRIKAIASAKTGDWDAACDINQEILAINGADLSALNRLGMAQMQLQKTKDAEATFKRVLELDSTNLIAKRQLERIKSKEPFVPPTFASDAFIEEPGKAKLCQLHRLAGKDVLAALSIGQRCQLKPKSRYISVETLDSHYIGSLPDDVSFRLSKLISGGNTYDVLIHSVDKTECSVFIKELSRSKANQNMTSFPMGTAVGGSAEDADSENYLFMDEQEQGGRYDKTTAADQNAEDEAEFTEETSGFTDEDLERLQ